MIRAYKFLLRPTAGQETLLSAMLADHCSLYNGAVQERRDAYRHSSKTSIKYGDQSVQLKAVRAFDPERQGRWSFSSQQATLRRLDRAFQAFFRREGRSHARLPALQGRRALRHGDVPEGRRWLPLGLHPHDKHTRVRLQGVGHVRGHQHRSVRGRVKTISINNIFFRSNLGQRAFTDVRIESRAEDIVRILGQRGLEVTGETRQRIEACRDLDDLGTWLDRAVTASRTEELFADV